MLTAIVHTMLQWTMKSQYFPCCRSGGLDDSFDSQVASEMDALDEVTDMDLQPSRDDFSHVPSSIDQHDGVHDTCSKSVACSSSDACSSASSLLSGSYQSGDHVSCEDLLQFALDRPDARRTAGPQHGENSDQCKLIRKILKNQVCVLTLRKSMFVC